MNQIMPPGRTAERYLLALFFICAWNTPSFCGRITDDSSGARLSIPGTVLYDITIGFQDAAGYAGAPLKFSGREWITAASGIAAATLIIFADEEIERLVNRDRRRIFDGKFQEIPIKYGQVEYGGIFAAGLYGAGLFTKTDGLRITGRMLGQSLIYSGSAVMILRWAFGRTRPSFTGNAWDFNWFEPRFRLQAFPSGHATVSFALSTILSDRINNTLASIGLFGLAAIDCFFQVYNHEHWLSDIIVGSVIGIGTSVYVIDQEEKRRGSAPTSSGGFRILPANGGLKISYTF